MFELAESTVAVGLMVVGALALLLVFAAPIFQLFEEDVGYDPTSEEALKATAISEGDRVAFAFADRREKGEVIGRRGKRLEILPDNAGAGVNEIVYRKDHDVEQL